MDVVLRNPAFARQCLIAAAAVAVLATASFLAGGSAAALGAFSAGSAVFALFSVFCIARYRDVARLSSEIDRLLHDDRSLVLSDYREGDLSILRNEVAKACARLVRSADGQRREKAFLADALADISHQIRTPLTAIEIMVPVIERTEDAQVRRAKLRELENMVDRMSWLVTALLKMARIDAGAAKLTCVPQDALAVVRAAVRPLAVALDVRDIACRVEAEGSPVFTGDAAWTAEAIGNVVKNCMEHTPAGGSITVSVSEDALACRIRVKDSGPGIAPEDLPHVFERFYRGRAAQSGDLVERPAGFGIGLSLAQMLVNEQGGCIRAANDDGGGARFDIVFPKVNV